MGLLLTAALLPACGGDEFETETQGAGGGGGGATTSSSSSSGTTTSGTTGSGGLACEPGVTASCYAGPAGTEGVGACAAGMHKCKPDGSGFGACEGEVLPATEDCATPEDDDCDGVANQPEAGCVCVPAAVEPCYEGPAGTEGVGLCAAGTHTCDALGTSWGACEAQVLPTAEDCAQPGDEDCDGSGCSDPLWSKIFGDASPQAAYATGSDAQGNVYVAGAFDGAMAVEGQQLISGGSYDVFVAKLDPTGALLWAKQFGGTGDQSAYGLAVDASGNVLVTGAFQGDISFGGATLSASSAKDAFVAKLASDGSQLWAVKFGGIGDQVPSGIAVDGAGNAIVTGSYDGSLAFFCNMPCAYDSKGGKDIFVRKLAAADGAMLWNGNYGDASDQLATSVTVDPLGNVSITGRISGSPSLGGAVLAGNPDDLFVAHYDAMGNHAWSKRMGMDALVQEGNAIAADSAGNLVIVGQFAGALGFGGAPLTTAGQSDMFVAKLNAAGVHLWSKAFGDAGPQSMTAVTIDGNDDIIVGGLFAGTVDLGGGALASPAQSGLLLAKLDGAGNHVWSKAAGVTGSQAALGLATTSAFEILVAGASNGSLDFGDGVLTSAGNLDAILAKIAP